MMNSESPSAPSFVGHVKNGMVVLDVQIPLADGQAVRVQPIEAESQNTLDAQRAGRVAQLQRLFSEWTEEDGKLSDEEADQLRIALDQHRGLRFPPAHLD